MRRNLRQVLVIAALLLATRSIHGEQGAAEQAKQDQSPFIGTKNTIKNDRVTAYMNIEGKLFPVAIDTGMGLGFALFKPVVDQLGLEVEDVEDSPIFYSTMVRVGTDNLGTLSEPRKVLVLDTPIVREHFGVIGWPAIDLTIFELDVPNDKWYRHAELPAEVAEQWQSFPIVNDSGGNLSFHIPDKEQQILVTLDTGSVSGVNLNKKEWEKWRQEANPSWVTLDSAYSPATRGGFSVTKTAIADDYHLGQLNLGRVGIEETFSEVSVDGQPLKGDRVILGMQTLKQRRVVVDGPGQRIYFGPIGKPSKALAKINRAQATLVPKGVNSKEVTAHVIKDGVAYKAGLRHGDNVLMVNGMLTANWKKDESVRPGATLRDKPGTRVRLLIERDGERFPITFKLGRSPLDPAPDEEGQRP